MPELSVTDQTITENGRLQIESIITSESSLVLVYTWEEDALGTLLGTAEVAASEESVEIVIDPFQATEQLAAQLVADLGEAGSFEPETDTPLTEPVPFTVDVQLPVPVISVSDQDLTLTNTLRINSAEIPMAGWLVIQSEANDEPDEIINFAYLEAGSNDNIQLAINPFNATPRLYATLYRDNGRLRTFEPDEADSPLQLRNAPVTIGFDVMLPQDIYVLDQPVVDGLVEIERIYTNSAGWVAVYNDNEGQPDFIIGSEAIEAGLNENIIVEVTTQQITPQLYLRLHGDNEPVGEFNPGADLLQATADGRIPGPTPININPGDYLIVADHGLTTTLTMPLVVVANDSWLVIYDEVDDAPSTPITQLLVPAGINRDVSITLEEPLTVGAYYATLHQDLGTLQSFDAEEDTVTQYNGRSVQLRFQIVANAP